MALNPSRRGIKKPPFDVLEKAVRAQAGIVSSVARVFEVDPSTVRRWRYGSRKIDALFQEVREETLDLAESKLLQNIKAGKTAEIIFYLKCMGKSRGYVERSEISGTDGTPLVSAREIADDRRFVDRMIHDPEARKAYSVLLGRIAGPDS